ncbi:WhiB family redox-sensing transcriptional regulator [Microbacterium testaceum]|uniref:WhiB family transcriptional regulator n=1 Tax=Microbacterium testaceum TaxID=2033 RepID=UPI002782FE2F|nr:WhiB family transcriptional regulator [Microbacterium testaceum]MDQ1174188.1 WhiB family redox-sensing transcriptional regulator [Microbacterium testaceum]
MIAAEGTPGRAWSDGGMLQPEPWVADAACTQMDPDAFFPDRGDSTVDARLICRSCPVQAECLEYALRMNETDGIWGGKSPRERSAIRRKA